jgi:hypothetical protein
LGAALTLLRPWWLLDRAAVCRGLWLCPRLAPHPPAGARWGRHPGPACPRTGLPRSFLGFDEDGQQELATLRTQNAVLRAAVLQAQHVIGGRVLLLVGCSLLAGFVLGYVVALLVTHA